MTDFDFSDINLDFLQSTPPRRQPQVPERSGTPTIKTDFDLGPRRIGAKKNIKSTKKVSEWAIKVADTNELLVEIKKLKCDKLELQTQLKDLQESAVTIQSLYSAEKKANDQKSRDILQLQKKFEQVDGDLTVKNLKCDQLEAQLAIYRDCPIDYNALVVKYLRLLNKLDEDDCLKNFTDRSLVENLRQHCAKYKLKAPPPCSPKLTKPRRLQKEHVGVQCELLNNVPADVKPPPSTNTQGTQCHIEMRSQGSQHISTMTTRGTTTACFIKYRTVGTSFQDPQSVPIVDDILREFAPWQNITPVSPLIDQTTTANSTSKQAITRTFKSIGTCTWLCNVRRTIDFIPRKRHQRAHELRSSSSCDVTTSQSIKLEATTPSPSLSPNVQPPVANNVPNSQTAIPGTSSNPNTGVVNPLFAALQTSMPLRHLHENSFDGLWHIFGRMLLGLLQNSSAGIAVNNHYTTPNQESVNQHQFYSWLRELYENSASSSDNHVPTQQSQATQNIATSPINLSTTEETVPARNETLICSSPLHFNPAAPAPDSENIIRPQPIRTYVCEEPRNQEGSLTVPYTHANGDLMETSSDASTSTSLSENESHAKNCTKENSTLLCKTRKKKTKHKQQFISEIQDLFPETKLSKSKRKALKRLLKATKPKRNTKKIVSKKADRITMPNNEEETAVDFLNEIFESSNADRIDIQHVERASNIKPNNHKIMANEESKSNNTVDQNIDDSINFKKPQNLCKNFQINKKPQLQHDSNKETLFKSLFGDSDTELEDNEEYDAQEVNNKQPHNEFMFCVPIEKSSDPFYVLENQDTSSDLPPLQNIFIPELPTPLLKAIEMTVINDNATTNLLFHEMDKYNKDRQKTIGDEQLGDATNRNKFDESENKPSDFENFELSSEEDDNIEKETTDSAFKKITKKISHSEHSLETKSSRDPINFTNYVTLNQTTCTGQAAGYNLSRTFVGEHREANEENLALGNCNTNENLDTETINICTNYSNARNGHGDTLIKCSSASRGHNPPEQNNEIGRAMQSGGEFKSVAGGNSENFLSTSKSLWERKNDVWSVSDSQRCSVESVNNTTILNDNLSSSLEESISTENTTESISDCIISDGDASNSSMTETPGNKSPNLKENGLPDLNLYTIDSSKIDEVRDCTNMEISSSSLKSSDEEFSVINISTDNADILEDEIRDISSTPCDNLIIDDDDGTIDSYEETSEKAKEQLGDTAEIPNAKLVGIEEMKSESIASEKADLDCLNFIENLGTNANEISTLLDSTLCKDILSDSILPLVADVLRDDALIIKTPMSDMKKPQPRGRKRKSESQHEEMPPCKRSERLRAKSNNVSVTPMEIGKYTRKNGDVSVLKSKLSEKAKAKSVNNHHCNDTHNIGEKEFRMSNLKMGFFREISSTDKDESDTTFLIETNVIAAHKEPEIKNILKPVMQTNATATNQSPNKEPHEHDINNSNIHRPNNQSSNYNDSFLFSAAPTCDAATDSETNNDGCGSINTNFEYTESPASPPAADEEALDSVVNSATFNIPLELSPEYRPRPNTHSLLENIMNHYSITQYNRISNLHNQCAEGNTKREKLIFAQYESLLSEYCNNPMDLDPDITTIKVLASLQQFNSIDYSLLSRVVLKICKNSESSELKENELPSVIHEMPPRHISRTLQRLYYLLKHIANVNSAFCMNMLCIIDSTLFNIHQSEKISLVNSVNLIQLYLMSCKTIEHELSSHPARVLIAKCLYFHAIKSVAMIHEILMWYPTVLPPKEERNYDRSDALISVIQQMLMSTKYDMTDLRGKCLLSKLRFEYHYLPFNPSLDETISNLVEKLKMSKFCNLCFAFSLICKRMSPTRTENLLQTQLLPLAIEYFNQALKTTEYDDRAAHILDIISKIVKPFPLDADVEVYLNLFSRFLSNFNRSLIQESAVCAIIRLQRFGYVNCFRRLISFKPTFELSATTQATLKTFIHRKPLSFLHTITNQSRGSFS